jgi:hypothetical protein
MGRELGNPLVNVVAFPAQLPAAELAGLGEGPSRSLAPDRDPAHAQVSDEIVRRHQSACFLMFHRRSSTLECVERLSQDATPKN